MKFLVANVLKFSKPMYRQRVKGPLDLRKLSWDGRDYLLFRDTRDTCPRQLFVNWPGCFVWLHSKPKLGLVFFL